MNLGSETEQVEFRKSTSELREGMESIASILNKHESGQLYFGVRPDGEVIGQEVSEKTLRQVSQAIGNHIRPVIHPLVEELEDGDGHTYIHIAFSGQEQPYSCDGRYRIRVADEDLIMSGDQLGRMYLERAAKLRPWDEWPSGRHIEDVDEAALWDFVERGRQNGRILSKFETSVDVLEAFGLMSGAELTNAAAVLFCPSQDVRLKMAVFENHARTEVLDLQQVQGTVFSLIDAAEHYVLANTRRRLIIKDGGPREEVPEIPRQAVREAVTNAFAHMDWTLGGAVLVEIYHDDIEIDSPGWFIEGQNPGEHLNGLSRSSRTRNSLIARTLYRSGDIESEGTGIPRIKMLCDEAGIRIEYVHTPDGARLIMRRNDAFMEGSLINSASENAGTEDTATDAPHSQHDVMPDVATCRDLSSLVATWHDLAIQWDTLSKLDKDFLEYLAGHGPSRTVDIAKTEGVSQRTVQRVAKQLLSKGLVIRQGKANESRYVLARESDNGNDNRIG